MRASYSFIGSKEADTRKVSDNKARSGVDVTIEIVVSYDGKALIKY